MGRSWLICIRQLVAKYSFLYARLCVFQVPTSAERQSSLGSSLSDYGYRGPNWSPTSRDHNNGAAHVCRQEASEEKVCCFAMRCETQFHLSAVRYDTESKACQPKANANIQLRVSTTLWLMNSLGSFGFNAADDDGLSLAPCKFLSFCAMLLTTTTTTKQACLPRFGNTSQVSIAAITSNNNKQLDD